MKNYTGLKFNKLTAISFSKRVGRRTFWLFKCDCGKDKIAEYFSVKSGSTGSCGCLKRQASKLALIKANHSLKINGRKNTFIDDGTPSFKAILKYYKDSAKKRNIIFSLTDEQFSFIINSNCHYCGIKPSKSYSAFRSNSIKRYNPYVYNGIDRKDNSLGYLLLNSLPCCWICNRAKRDDSYDQFLGYIQQLTQHHGRR